MSNGIFNFNFLALVLSEILGGFTFTLGCPAPPVGPLAKNLDMRTSTCIIVNFQLRRSINAVLTERSLNNRFCIEKSAKMGICGEGLRYLVGTPHRNAMTADLRRLVKKNVEML